MHDTRTTFNVEVDYSKPFPDIDGPECFGHLWDPHNSVCMNCPASIVCCTKSNVVDQGWYLGDMRFDLLPTDIDLTMADKDMAIEWLMENANSDMYWADKWLKYHLLFKDSKNTL